MQTVRQFFFIVQILHRNGTHTDDPVHRRSYFVAHAGKKLTLGPACRLDFLQIALNDSGLHPCAADQQNRNNQNQQNERHNGHKQDRIGIDHFRKGEPAHADRNHVSIQYCGLFFAGQIINSLIEYREQVRVYRPGQREADIVLIVDEAYRYEVGKVISLDFLLQRTGHR